MIYLLYIRYYTGKNIQSLVMISNSCLMLCRILVKNCSKQYLCFRHPQCEYNVYGGGGGV